MEAPEFNTDCESSLESRGEMFGGDKCDPRMKESPKIQFWPCDCDIFGGTEGLRESSPSRRNGRSSYHIRHLHLEYLDFVRGILSLSEVPANLAARYQLETFRGELKK